MKAARAVLWSGNILALAFITWMAFVGNTSLQEMAVGAACAVFCAAASLLTWKAMELSIAFNLRDVLELWRLPWNVVQDAWTITYALALDLLNMRRCGSHFRAVMFEEHSGRRGRLRHVLAVAYTTVTPNSIVIGIDDEQRLMLFHQIVPSEMSAVTRRLGARP